MQIPPFVEPGSKVGIVASARKVSEKELFPAVRFLQDNGYVPVLGKHIYDDNNQFAGSDENRATDFQTFMEDPDIQVVWFVRGGYGSIRILDYLYPEKFGSKWIVGYSDITAIHGWGGHHLSFPTVHGPMPIDISKGQNNEKLGSFNTLFKLLKGESPQYTLSSHPLDLHSEEISGKLIGGNLSVLYSCLGSDAFPETKGNVLFLEDLDEYLYHIDRMMMNLHRSGVLASLNGMIIGGMTDMNDNTVPFGHTAEEIIFDFAKRNDIPVKFGFPAGHQDTNLALLMGYPCEIRDNVFRQSL